MKISGKQLEMVLAKMQYAMLGYDARERDFEIEITMTQEDPGTGAMVSCLTLKATKEPKENDEKDIVETMIAEIYPSSEKQPPRATKTESFKITSKY